MVILNCSFSFLLLLGLAVAHAAPPHPVTTTASPPASPVIVMGFVGGYVHHDDRVHSTVQLAANLRKDYTSGVYVETVENHRREDAHKEILKLLDADHDGKLSAEEKKSARIILYGHSWGASEAITLARELEKDGIPVQLTIQVDSVAKRGQDDQNIPANVALAANFYQSNGFLHGQAQIRAVNATRTRILGNFQFDYKAHPITCSQYPWYDRVFMKYHTEIECDPSVWKQVEALIRSNLPSAPPAVAGTESNDGTPAVKKLPH